MAKDKKDKKEPPKKVIKKATKAKAKKHWVPLLAPKSFSNANLGDSHVAENENIVGKSITVNLMNLTGDMRKQGVEIRFDILKLEEGKGHTAVTGYELLPSNLKRIIRRGRSKIADSFLVKTGTGRIVRIKPIVITINHASNAACTAIRQVIRARSKELLAATSFDKLVQELIAFKMQRALKDAAGKIHPVKSVEIKSCTLLPIGAAEGKQVSEDTRTEDFVEVVEKPKVQAKPEAEKKAEA